MKECETKLEGFVWYEAEKEDREYLEEYLKQEKNESN